MRIWPGVSSRPMSWTPDLDSDESSSRYRRTTSTMSGSYDLLDGTDHLPASPNWTPSESIHQAIRMVPYSPPRLESQQSYYSQQNSPISQTTPLHHSHSRSLPLQESLYPTSSSPRGSPRHQRQRQRKHRSRELDGNHVDDIEGGANDSDRTTTTVTSRRSRRSKPSRPNSWGPAAAFAAAVSAVSAVTGAASSGLRSVSSTTSTASSPAKGDTNDRHERQGSVLSEKSRNIMIGGKRSDIRKEAALSGHGSTFAMAVGADIPSARGSHRGVSDSKLTSPTTTSATTTNYHNATSATPPSNIRHIRHAKYGSVLGDDATASNSSRLLAHNSQLQHQHQPQPYPHNASSPASLSSSHARLGLPPASASFSAAAASYLTEQSSKIGNISNFADSLTTSPSPDLGFVPSSPASPASAYSAFSASPSPSQIPISYPINYSPSQPSSAFSPSQQSSLPSSYQSSATSYPSSSFPPPVSNTAASSYTLAAPSLSPSPSIGSLSSVASSQTAAPRPHSRRRNIIAVHSDKTFSLVPRGGPPQPQSQPPSAVPAIAATLKSPPLSLLSFSNSATSSTVRSSASQERLFSYGAYNNDGHSSSPLTTSASTTLEDPSKLELHLTPSPGSRSEASTIHFDFDGPQPWNQRLVGGLRRDPKTPDAKRKGKGRADTFTLQPRSSTQFLPPLPETSSLTTAVFAGPSASETPAGVGSRSHKKKPSSASVHSFDSSALSFSASTLSATTNYKVYDHSSSPVAHADLEPSDSLGDLSLQETQDRQDSSDGSFLSSHAHAHPGDTTNVEILGVSSPAAPPLPELQRSNDPDQSFASFKSFPSIASFDSEISSEGSTLPNFVVLGASSPPAPSRYLDHIRSTADSDAELDAHTEIDISSSPPLPARTANTTTSSFETTDSDQNYVLHGEPSSIFLPPSSSPGEQSLVSVTPAAPQTASSSSGSSLATISKPPRQVYSRESLLVPPLKTLRAKRSHERFGYYKSRSRESLRRAASLKSISSSIFNQEAASTFFAGQAFLSLNIPPVPVFSPPKTYAQQQLPAFLAKTAPSMLRRKPLPVPRRSALSENVVVYGQTSENTRGLPADDSWASSSPSQLSSSPFSPSTPISAPSRPISPTLPQQPQTRVQMVEEHPHQWSSQLSTVMSESEDDSMDIRLVSRSVSAMSGAPSRPESIMRGNASVVSARSGLSGASNGSGGRRSSAGWVSSTHSRTLPSISSSLAAQMDELRDRNSRDSSLLERPTSVFLRTASPATPGSGAPFSPPSRTVRDLDEHGDGLADLHGMSSQPSRSALSSFLASSNNSARNLHSSSSVHSLRSAGSGHFPAWVRVYYGSGERRSISAAPSISDIGQGDDYMTGAIRPTSTFRRSPSMNNGRFSIFNMYRRQRDGQPDGPQQDADAVDLEAGEAGNNGTPGVFMPRRPQGLRRITSSIWSPHLQTDRRATRFSVWDPPSVAWSDTTSRFDRRNMQVLLFTLGFVMPFAWMVASFLPLPLDPKRAMEKRVAEEGEYGVAATLKQRTALADENRFQSARWWRRLNRVMSLFGVLVLGVIIALVILTVTQHWDS